MTIRSKLLMFSLLLVIAFLVLYPTGMLVYGSFRSESPMLPGVFSIKGYLDAFSSVANYEALLTTIWLGAIRIAIAMCIAISLAWVITRTDTPGKGILEVLIWFNIFIPSQTRLMAWIMLLAPKVGLVNKAVQDTFGVEKSPFNIYSYGGIIWVDSFSWAAFIFLLITPAFRGMDSALEESSRMSGASWLTTLRWITLPALAPAMLGALMLAQVKVMESFETELFLGLGAGIYVYSTRIYDLVSQWPTDYPQAMALTNVFLLIVFAIIIIQWRLLGRRHYTTITGRGFAVRPMRLGRWKWVTLGIVLTYFVLSTVSPLVILFMSSFMKFFGVFGPDRFTLDNWKNVLADTQFWPSVRNTIILAVMSTLGGMIFYSIISYVVIRTKFQARKALDFLAWLPWAFPSMVLALGFLWAFVGGLRFPFVLYGTLWLLIVVFMVKGLPVGVRVMNGAMVQIGSELEESSRTLGASWVYTFRRIMAPLLSPAFVASAIILFILTIRDVVTVVLLYTPKSRVISMLMFEYWFANRQEWATVVGTFTVLLIIVFAVVARIISARQEIPTG